MYKLIINSEGFITNFIGTLPSVFKIPKYVNDIRVIGIAPKAFMNQKTVKKLILSDHLLVIGDLAFYNGKLRIVDFGSFKGILGYACFESNEIKRIKKLRNIEIFSECCFSNNNLTKIILSRDNQVFEDSSFSYNKIKKIINNSYHVEYKKDCFYENPLSINSE